MLSRLALRNSRLLCPVVRPLQTTTYSSPAIQPERHPERVVQNEHPGAVRFGFVPEEWFTFFYPKTGVTGPYLFFGGFGTYIFSKEWYVCEHEFYNALSFIIIWIVLVKKFGKGMAAFADKQIEEQEQSLKQMRTDLFDHLNKGIEEAEQSKLMVRGMPLISEAKMASVLVQLETIYRERIHTVYNEVKKRLDYELQVEFIDRRIAQKHMLAWVLDSVKKAITPDLEKQALQQCIVDLQSLAKA